MDEVSVREHAEALCEALLAGDIDRATHDLSAELRANLGQLVAMLPMPLTAASIEWLERTAAGFRAVLHLVGENAETRVETRWKDRDNRPAIVEVSHLTEDAAEIEGTPEATPED